MRNILNEEKEKQNQGTLAQIKREVRDKSLEKQVELYQREIKRLGCKKNCNRPIFHETSDITGGLTICVNDTWGNTVEVTDYTFDGEHFSGNLHFAYMTILD